MDTDNCQSRSVPEIPQHVAEMLSKQVTNKNMASDVTRHPGQTTRVGRTDHNTVVYSFLAITGQCWSQQELFSTCLDRFVGLVVRRPPRERKIPGSNPACAGIFSGSSHTSDLKIGTPVATLPGAWRYRVSAGTGRPGVSIL